MYNSNLLIKQVKAAGQEIIDRAEDFVGNAKLLTDFNIWISFSTDSVPSIEITREYISKNCIDVISRENKWDMKEENNV